jgi:putative addiction module component (TIGR02574 family)
MSSVAPKSLPTTEQILEQALQLPKEQRLRLAEQLRESIEDEGWPEDVHPTWRAEISRRLVSLHEGTAAMIDGDQHLRRLRDKYGA